GGRDRRALDPVSCRNHPRMGAGVAPHHGSPPGRFGRDLSQIERLLGLNPMRIDVLTIFPEYFGPAFDSGMIRIARERGVRETQVVTLRDFTDDGHRTTDDSPFGGGAGMVMRPEPIFRAVEFLTPVSDQASIPPPRVVVLSPQGKPFCQEDAIRLSR